MSRNPLLLALAAAAALSACSTVPKPYILDDENRSQRVSDEESERQARELAKAASAENYLRTGIESDYQIIDAHDDEAVGIDTAEKEAAAEERRRRTVNGAAWTAKRLREIEQAQEKARQESVADFTIDTQPGAVTV